MDADGAGYFFPGPGQCQGGHSAEAESDGGEASICVRPVPEHVQSGSGALGQRGGVVAQGPHAVHDPLMVAGHAVAVRVACQDHVAERRPAAALLASVVVQFRAAVDEQNARTFLLLCVAVVQHTRQERLISR